jgi:peroxiredoxin
MNKHIYVLAIASLFALACQRDPHGQSREMVTGKQLADTQAYAFLVEGFEKQFAAIEAEYDTASIERRLELEARYQALDQSMVEAQKQYIRDYPASPQSLKVLREIDWSFLSAMEFRQYLDGLDPDMHSLPLFTELDDLVSRMEQVEVDRHAPDFSMSDVEGKTQKLSDKYAASRYLLLEFWASHCGPCREENPNIRLAYQIYHPQGFDVLGISTDIRREQWIRAIETDSLTWTNLCSLESWNENEVVHLYALRQVSQNFLLDSTGKIIARDLRGEELMNRLEALFTADPSGSF